MAEIQEHVAYLSQTIGPRPAGTEEEQQAALYITEKLQKDAGFSAVVEDFNCNPDDDIPLAVCSGLAFIAMVVAILVPFLGILAFVISLIAAILFAAEVFNRPIISRFLNRGVSQNVIARYEPGMTETQTHSRQRKVILVAHYDSGKVDRLVNSPLFPILPVLQWVSFVGVCAVAVLLLVRIIVDANGLSPFPLFIITVIAGVCALFPLIATIIKRGAPYNEGANCNAAGVSVLLEVANRIGNGKVSEAEMAAIIHGRQAAQAAGLVPEGTELVYEADDEQEDTRDATERLLSAKAAVAALTGKPVSEVANIDLSSSEDDLEHPSAKEMLEAREETLEAFAPQDPAPVADTIVIDAESSGEHPVPQPEASEIDAQMASEMVAEGTPAPEVLAAAMAPATAVAAVAPKKEPSVPDWFKSAQQKAKKQETRPNTVHRSRYAEALEAAERERAERAAAEIPVEPSVSETERRLQEMRDSIMGVKSPTYDGMIEKQAQVAAAAAEARLANAAAQASAAEEAALEGQTIAFTPMMMEEIEGSLQENDASESSAPVVTSENDSAQEPTKVEAEVILTGEDADNIAAALSSNKEGNATNVVVVEQANIQVDDVVVALTPPDAEFKPHPAITEYKTSESVKEKAASALSSVLPPSISARLPFIGEDGSVKATRDKPVHEVSESPAAQEAKHAVQAQKAGGTTVPASEKKPKRKQRSISLPSISATDTPVESDLAPLNEISVQQPAPLSEPRPAATHRVHDLSGIIPSIAADDEPRMPQVVHPAQIPSPKQSGIIPSLDASKSGTLPQVSTEATTDPSTSSSLIIPSITGSTPPVKEHKHSREHALDILFTPTTEPDEAQPNQEEAVSFEDIVVPDVDDSAYVEYGAEEGSFAVPGMVEMPKSRASRFFDRFSRNKKSKNESSPQEWLDVADDFDAREVGKARGSWDSFKREDGDSAYTASAFDEDGFDDYESFEEYDDLDTFSGGSGRGSHWSGGMFSRDLFDSVGPIEEISNTGRVNTPTDGAQVQADEQEAQAAAIAAAAIAAAQLEIAAETSAQQEAQAQEEARENEALLAQAAADLSQVVSFRHPDINTEVWFVALGSELAANGGMNAFITEHAQDLRGAIIVDLEGLGAGELSLIEAEGKYFTRKTSSRMDRLARKAATPLGIKIQKATMKWRNSAAAFAMARGYQAMHVAGMTDGRPTYFGQKADVLENVDTETMLVNADFVMELLKNI